MSCFMTTYFNVRAVCVKDGNGILFFWPFFGLKKRYSGQPDSAGACGGGGTPKKILFLG